MKLVHIGEGSDKIKKLGPSPQELDTTQKRYYQQVGKVLVKADRLKATFLPALKILAVNLGMYHFAISEINKANKTATGSGYIQKFSSGAANITPYVTLKKSAEDRIMQCLKQFGMDPKSDKDLGANDSGQLSLFEEVMKKLKSGT